jgi:hypothetical protein
MMKETYKPTTLNYSRQERNLSATPQFLHFPVK